MAGHETKIDRYNAVVKIQPPHCMISCLAFYSPVMPSDFCCVYLIITADKELHTETKCLVVAVQMLKPFLFRIHHG